MHLRLTLTFDRDKRIINQIKKLKDQIKEDASGKDLKEFLTASVKDVIASKRKILNINIDDYYEVFSIVDKDGVEYTKAKAKLLSEISPEKKTLIEDVTFAGKNGEAHYTLPSKSKAEAAIISLYKDLCCKQPEKDSDSDGNALYSFLRQSMVAGEAIMKKNEELSKLAGFECLTANTPKED